MPILGFSKVQQDFLLLQGKELNGIYYNVSRTNVLWNASLDQSYSETGEQVYSTFVDYKDNGMFAVYWDAKIVSVYICLISGIQCILVTLDLVNVGLF